MARRIVIALVVVACVPVQAAMALVKLPQQVAPTDDGQMYYFGLDGNRAFAYDTSWDVLAVPIDGSATDGGTLPVTATIPPVVDPMCTSGDPEDQIGGDESIATGEGQLIAWGFSGCKLGDGGSSSVDVAGPASGPFTSINLDQCAFGGFPHVAISSQYAVCADPDSALIETSSLTNRVDTRSYRPGVLVRSLKVAGRFLAVASRSSITVSDLRSGKRVLTVKRRAPLVYAIGDDGTLVVGHAHHAAGPCRTLSGLAWYSARSPHAHAIGYRACAMTMFLIARKLVFQAPGRNSQLSIDRGSLGGSTPSVVARYSRSGALLSADAEHVLGVDDCQGEEITFVAPGGRGTDPSSPCR